MTFAARTDNPLPPPVASAPVGTTATVAASAGTAGTGTVRTGAAGRGAARAARVAGAMRGATPLALAGLFANAANLAVTLVIARHMSTRSYGAVAQLFAIFFVVSMPGSALLVGVVRRATTWVRTGEAYRVPFWLARIRRAGMALILSITLVALATRGFIAAELSLPGPGGVVEIIAAGAAWCLLCVDRGIMQSGRLYSALAANLLADALIKSTFTVGLVLVGLDEAGAALGVLLGVLAAIAHARWTLHRHPLTSGEPAPAGPQAAPGTRPGGERTAGTPGGPGIPGGPGDRDVRQVPPARAAVGAEPGRLYVEVGAALVALAFLGVLQNVDVLVQGKLAPDESGSYAAVSVASKVLVFGAIVLAGFLLPEAADRRHLGQHALHQLGATLAILAVPATCLLAIAVAAPGMLLSVAFGSRFTDASDALLPLAAAMTCLGATVLFTHYLLALGQRSVLVALGVATALAVPLTVWAGGDPAGTARADLAAQAALALVTGLMVLTAARRTARA